MNALVTDTPARVERIAAVLESMDARPRQVAIEAKLVETALGKDEKLGVDWQLRASAAGAVLPTTFPFPKSAGSGDFTAEPNPNNQVGRRRAAFPPGQNFLRHPGEYVFGKLSFQEFTVAMDILKQTSSTNLVSAPKITTTRRRRSSSGRSCRWPATSGCGRRARSRSRDTTRRRSACGSS